MSKADDQCEHPATHVRQAELPPRRHGRSWVHTIGCNECLARVVLRTFEDERDDHTRKTRPDGPAVYGERPR